jgi:hypothetical protein
VLVLGLAANALAQPSTIPGWWNEDIGVPLAGSATKSGDIFTITGNGHDIWDAADDFRYVHKELTGDGMITARVVNHGTGSNTWAKGGVMMRDNNTAGSPDAYTVVPDDQANGACFQWRDSQGGGANWSGTGAATAVNPPHWLRLVRVGNTFTGYHSANGVNWTQLPDPHTVVMQDPVLIGLCVTSHATGELRTYQFDNVTLSGNITDKPPQLKALGPDPADGKTGVTIGLVGWKTGETAAFHDVYYGTNPTPGPAEYKGRQGYLVYWFGVLTPGTTYYWRVDEVEADGTKTYTGDVWSFTAAPLTAYGPIPSDGAKWVATDADLSWTAGAAGVKHDVYFGTDQAAVANGTGGTLKSPQQTTKTYEPGTLALDTTYYWRIDEFDSGGAKYPGAVWTFSTISASAGIRGYYFNNMNVTGVPVLVRIDPTINFNWGDPGSPDPAVNVDQFSARWVGVVEALYSEPYTFTCNTDDGFRMWLDDVLIIDSWVAQSPTMHSSPAINLVAGQRYGVRVEYYEDGGGATAQLFWESPSTPRQIIPAGALQLPLAAGNPNPSSGAVDVKQTPTLRWSAGEKAVKHNVYLGTDATAVANATTASAGIYRGQQNLAANSYVPSEAPLAWNSAYYWRIDEVNAADTWKGSVWSFTTADFIVVDDFEDYTDDVGSRIFQTWKDGWGYNEPAPGYPGNGTGSAVGYSQPPFAELITVHGGGQSMPLGYDNSGATGKARYSETVREWTSPQDWTVNNVKALTLYVRGIPLDFLESPAGTFTMSAEGSDIWAGTDEFRYVYKQLSGDGEIIARVVRIAGPATNEWRKGGVMIRETLDPTSKHAFMAVSPNPTHGLAFQYRDGIDAADSDSEHGVDNQTSPYWVKVVRKGNVFTGYHSPDGITWTMKDPSGTETDASNPVTITMASNVYIGLALTSHENDVLCMAQFSNVSTGGSVTGAWTVVDIASTVTGTNDDEPLYVAVEDSSGKIKVVTNDNPLAAVDPDWQEWNIELTQFSGAGVNLKAIKKMYIGLGSRTSPKVGGTGTIYVDDIGVYPSRCVPSMGKPAADLSGNCVVDYADIEIMAGDWLASGAGLAADLHQDNVINFKDFAVLADSWLEEILWP